MESLKRTRITYSPKTIVSLLVYMVVHFGVDFACFYYLMGTFSLYQYTGMGPVIGFLLYNTLAFGLQLGIGRFFDHRNVQMAGLIGVFLVMAGLGINMVLPMVCKDALVLEYQSICSIPFKRWRIIILVLLAVGNAFFHVAGGIDSLCYSNGKSRRCGLFVAPGALGVSMGTYVGQNSSIEEVPILCGLFLCFALIATYGDGGHEKLKAEKETVVVQKTAPILGQSLSLRFPLLCFFAVVLRAYIGPLQKISLHALFLAGVCMVFGKAIGGVMADEFGGKIVGGMALVVSAVCFSGIGNHPLLTILGIVSFNMVMPITLYGMYEQFPNNPGTVFGLNSFALLIGYAIYSCGLSFGTHTVLFGCLLAAALVALGIPWKTKENTQDKNIRGELDGVHS